MSEQLKVQFPSETCTAIVAVRCPTHKIGMTPRPLKRQTKEQLFCGAWWDCPEFHCGCSTLFHSPELDAQLYAMTGKSEFLRTQGVSL